MRPDRPSSTRFCYLVSAIVALTCSVGIVFSLPAQPSSAEVGYDHGASGYDIATCVYDDAVNCSVVSSVSPLERDLPGESQRFERRTAPAHIRQPAELVAPSGLADDLGRLSCRSFSGDTQVVMADGTTKPISEVVVGDLVLASDPETVERAAQTVVRTLPHLDKLLVLETTVGRLWTTEDHLFWNRTDGEWQESQELDEGDALLSSMGGSILAIGLDWQTVRVDTAYDLDVSDFDTCFVSVGDESALVHNIECPWQLKVDPNFSSAHNRILDGPLPQTGQLSELTPGQLLDLQSDLTTSIGNRQKNLWDGTFPTNTEIFRGHAARVDLEVGLLNEVNKLLG